MATVTFILTDGTDEIGVNVTYDPPVTDPSLEALTDAQFMGLEIMDFIRNYNTDNDDEI